MQRDNLNDECVVCYCSLFKGLNLFSVLVNDCICSNCRSKLFGKLRKTKFEGLDMYYFYTYDEEVSKLLIQFKDLFDISLARLFLAPYYFFINHYFKKYQILIIPSSKTLLEKRGFNHLLLMLSDVDLEVFDILEKSDTIQRFSSDRLLVDFKFKSQPLTFDKVIIFDDVITSGYSMKKVINLIRPYASKIVLISVINNLKER